MFERFTDEARRVVVLAQEEARTLQHGQIGTEHLLLALLHEDQSETATVLGRLDADADGLRQAVLAVAGQGTQPSPADLAFTRQAKTALELAEREAVQLGGCDIWPCHLLLGLLRSNDGVGGTILRRHGVEIDAARAVVCEQPDDQTAELHVPPVVRAGAEDEPTMSAPLLLERFDDTAWQALTITRQHAGQRDDHLITTLDLLLGVAAADGPGAAAMQAAGVDADTLRAVADKLRSVADAPAHASASPNAPGSSSTHASPPMLGSSSTNGRGALRIDGPARHVLRWATEDADRRGQAAASTAHVLLALLCNADAPLSDALAALNISQEPLRDELDERLTADTR